MPYLARRHSVPMSSTSEPPSNCTAEALDGCLDLGIEMETWPLREHFIISRDTMVEAPVLVVTLECQGVTGRGEAAGVDFRGESVDSMRRELESRRGTIERGLTLDAIGRLLPAGGARNALDCAYRDLQAKSSGIPAWEAAGVRSLRPLTTAFTLSLGTPDTMGAAARRASNLPLLKLKLGADGDLDRVAAVRAEAPDAQIIVDANEAWSAKQMDHLLSDFKALNVAMIEQPLPANDDDVLREIDSPVPICADESCLTSDTIDGLAGKYDIVNIKLDKTGGLTEALQLARAAQRVGLELMVGCMVGTSLAMAPAFLIGQMCRFVDLDGPLLLQEDRPSGFHYENGLMFPFSRSLWG